MRYLLALTLVAAACTDVPSSGLHYDSVRDRLTDRPAWLYVHDDEVGWQPDRSFALQPVPAIT